MNSFDNKAAHWDANEVRITMTKAISDEIVRRVPLSKQMRIMEYGAGTGLLSFSLRDKVGQLLLADSSEGMLAVAREKITSTNATNMEARKLDLMTDEIPQDKFDIIISQMALHHVADIERIFQLFYKLLNEQGYLCIADLDKEDGSFHGHDFTGHNGFDRDELKNIAQKSGFEDIQFSTVFKMPRTGDDGSVREFPIFLFLAKK